MNKTCLIIQSGAMGDIFLVAPIAKYYNDRGFLVFWPVREKYFNIIQNYFPYANASLIDDERYPKVHSDWLRSDTINLQKVASQWEYDLIIDTSDRDPVPNQQPYENFEQYKYRIAEVPFAFKNHLSWKADHEKEQDLITIIQYNHGIDITKDEYVTAHLTSSHGDKTEIPEQETRKVIEITELKNFEILDWYPIIANSKAFYGVESSVQQFVDGCFHRLKTQNNSIELFLLSRSSLKPGETYTTSHNWDKKYMK
jgi:hypothetical protein